MIKLSDIPMQLGKKQKRIAYWREHFPKNTSNAELLKKSDDLISKFALLLTKLSKCQDEESLEESFSEVLAVEREITTLFEHARLKTTSSAVHEYKIVPVGK